MSEAEQLRDRALRALLRPELVPLPVPSIEGAFVGVRLVPDGTLCELRARAVDEARSVGLDTVPLILARWIARLIVEESLVQNETIDEGTPRPFIDANDARKQLDERAVDALLAVYLRHAEARARGAPHVS